jgi:hypothetical protein
MDDENDTLQSDQRGGQNHLVENWLVHESRPERIRNDLQNLLFLREQKINSNVYLDTNFICLRLLNRWQDLLKSDFM